MHHRVKSLQVRFREITDIFTHLRYIRGRIPELTACKQVGIQADHVMAGGTQEGARNSADITFMAGQQYSHTTLLECLSPFSLHSRYPMGPGLSDASKVQNLYYLSHTHRQKAQTSQALGLSLRRARHGSHSSAPNPAMTSRTTASHHALLTASRCRIVLTTH